MEPGGVPGSGGGEEGGGGRREPLHPKWDSEEFTASFLETVKILLPWYQQLQRPMELGLSPCQASSGSNAEKRPTALQAPFRKPEGAASGGRWVGGHIETQKVSRGIPKSHLRLLKQSRLWVTFYHFLAYDAKQIS